MKNALGLLCPIQYEKLGLSQTQVANDKENAKKIATKDFQESANQMGRYREQGESMSDAPISVRQLPVLWRR